MKYKLQRLLNLSCLTHGGETGFYHKEHLFLSLGSVAEHTKESSFTPFFKFEHSISYLCFLLTNAGKIADINYQYEYSYL